MARRKQFSQLITALRSELGRSTDPASSPADLPQLKQVLNRNYESLYDAYDWPFLTKWFAPFGLNEGERYYDFPTGVDLDRMETIVGWWNGMATPLTRGIGIDQFNITNSEDDERADPVERWDVHATATHEQIEVWPIPNSGGQTIQIRGRIKFAALVDEADLCLLDDHLVVLTSAVELMPLKSNIQAKLAAAQARLGVVKSRSKTESNRMRMGLGETEAPKGVILRVSG